LEANLCGIPAVAADIGGSPEVIRHGRTGLLFPYQKPQAMADSILKLLQKPQSIKRLGKAAQLRVERHFTAERQAVRTLQLYQQILKRPKPKEPENRSFGK